MGKISLMEGIIWTLFRYRIMHSSYPMLSGRALTMEPVMITIKVVTESNNMHNNQFPIKILKGFYNLEAQ